VAAMAARKELDWGGGGWGKKRAERWRKRGALMRGGLGVGLEDGTHGRDDSGVERRVAGGGGDAYAAREQGRAPVGSGRERGTRVGRSGEEGE
jgi:hypothetical protein